MCNICVFAGTTEGRELAEFLAGQPVQATVCVATEYGETLLPEAKNVTVLAGRIPVADIIRMLQETRFDLVIDATHPYAASITESICTACRETETEYLRMLERTRFIDGRLPDSNLLEVFTGAGCGTMIVGRKEKATYLGVDLAT